MYAIENEDCEPLFERIYSVFIAHEFCYFVERRSWRVTSPL
jgi:hypothetical protein